MKSAYRTEIDGFRALAVLPVISYHAAIGPFSGGFVGVDVFFVLSGYLITGLIVEDLEQDRFSIVQFYERRARRLLPALCLVLVICLPFAWALMIPEQLAGFARSLLATGLFASNILFWRESDYFGPAAEEKPLLHTWSLGVEEQFYVLFPLLLMLVWRHGGRSWIRPILAVAALASLLLSEWGARHYPDANFYLLPSRGWELLAGALCALMPSTRSRWDGVAALIGIGLVLGAMLAYDSTTPFPSIHALVPVGGTVLILRFAVTGTFVAKLLSTRPLVLIGLISYSAYLWHQPLMAFARLQWWIPQGSGLMAVMAGLSLALAYPTWRFVEAPFRGARPRALPGRRALFAGSGGVLATMIALGSIGHLANGFPSRLPDGFEDFHAEGRFEAIRAGRCHYNQQPPRAALDLFVSEWDCRPKRQAAGLPRLVVYGDSHAADVAMALRSAGLDPLQVGGMACPLLEGRGGPHCDPLLKLFLDEVRPGDWILLANRCSRDELEAESLRRVIDFWSHRGARVLLFSPLPEFTHYERIRVMRQAEGLAGMTPDFGPAIRFAEQMQTLEMGESWAVLDSWTLFCPEGQDCGAHGPEGFLYFDADHLAPAGADRFGANLRDALIGMTHHATARASLQ
ncbi:acyltransferase family protein [uncultured Limimaricola sp.]|uniref:acyltransferase family protein n=1 Tax=uncultured Limimaricola sp. TaxID=2211667 RepID=UPI0030F5F30A